MVPVPAFASLSVASAPVFATVRVNPATVPNVTEYVPGTRFGNRYSPLAFVVAVWVTLAPLPVVPLSVTGTPLMTGSPVSCWPFAFTSSQV